MNWVFISVVVASGFALADTFTKIASDKVSPIIGVVGLNLTSGIIALCVTLSLPFLGYEKQSFTNIGFVYAMIAGVFSFIAFSGFFLMFEKGAPLGIGVTITFVMSITLTMLISVLLLKETVSPQQIFGVFTALLSIYLLAPKE